MPRRAWKCLVLLTVVSGCALPGPTTPKAAPLPTPRMAATPTFPHPFIQLAWFYKPPEAGDLASIHDRFDLFILTAGDEPTLAALRAQGSAAPVLQYLRFDAIHDPGACTEQPRRNQAAYWPGDFCKISEQHPDWFLLDGSGQRMAYDDYVMMDPGHPGWRAFFLERIGLAQQAGDWGGVFLDNVEASLGKRRQRGSLPAAYPTDEAYVAAIEGFLQYLYASPARSAGRLLMANIISVSGESAWFRYLRGLDGAMEERFAVDWQGGYLDADEWEAQLSRIERTQVAGKRVLLVAQGTLADTARQRFALASYLMVNDGWGYLRYTNSRAYREIWLYENYGLDLGAPLGPRYLDGEIWRRDFAHGTVRVDPSAHTAEIAPTP